MYVFLFQLIFSAIFLLHVTFIFEIICKNLTALTSVTRIEMILVAAIVRSCLSEFLPNHQHRYCSLNLTAIWLTFAATPEMFFIMPWNFFLSICKTTPFINILRINSPFDLDLDSISLCSKTSYSSSFILNVILWFLVLFSNFFSFQFCKIRGFRGSSLNKHCALSSNHFVGQCTVLAGIEQQPFQAVSILSILLNSFFSMEKNLNFDKCSFMLVKIPLYIYTRNFRCLSTVFEVLEQSWF